jgi:hypothetical protein
VREARVLAGAKSAKTRGRSIVVKEKPRPPAQKPWRPWRPKLRVHAGPPQTTGDLMGEVLGRMGGQGRALEFRAFDAYARAVGELLRARTAPERLRGSTLFVRVTTSTLAHEVTLLRGEILARMATELGAGAVTELRTKVGKLAPPTEPS